MPEPRWAMPATVPASESHALERYVGLPLPLCELLVRRGFAPDSNTRRFLRPSFEDLHDPSGLTDLDLAADRIERAIRDEETILIHGDYDVDGMTGATLLAEALRELGARTTPFVPHRTRDGYDLGEAGVERARSIGARLIVTVDCGTSAVDAVAAAGNADIDVVVTDHHRPGPELPAALAIVNPNRSEQEYPFSGLAGVGVAFKLIQQLYGRQQVDDGRLNQYLDLVAFGTIADQAPLVDENRILARFGLRVLNRSRRVGLNALCRAAKAGRWSEVRATDVAFRLAPRLNSVGRIGDAGDGLDLLMSDDHAHAEALAKTVDRLNDERRETDRRILMEARERLAGEFDAERDSALVMWGEGWHTGVLGIVASRLVDELQVPVLLIGLEGDRARGSARSIPGFHLFRALETCRDLFDRFGGHAGAAGFDIRRDRLPALRERLCEQARREIQPTRSEILIDQALSIGEVTPGLVRGVTYLEPFGAGNPMPRFVARGVCLRDIEPIGQTGEHARLHLEQGGSSLDAVAFRRPDIIDMTDGRPRDVVFELHVEERARGLRSQAHVVALRETS